MVGSKEIEEKGELTARPENHVVDKKEKSEKVTQLVVQPNQCVLIPKGKRKARKELLGSQRNSLR